MASIPNLETHNKERIRLLNLSKDVDNALICTEDEIRIQIKNYLIEEFNFYTLGHVNKSKKEIRKSIDSLMDDFKKSILSHINDKFNEIVEEVITKTTNKVFEIEIEKRVNKKLNEIKNKL